MQRGEQSTEMIELVFYQPEHDEKLFSFELPDEQKQFTGMPEDSVALAMEDKHRFPIVITADDKPVGFFVLYDGDDRMDYTDNPKSLVLRAFSINYAEQGKGYAKKGLQLLRKFVASHFPQVEQVVLAVNVRNIAARSVYLKCGFQDDGRTKMGKKGPQHLLTLEIK